jgi:hypothetical protein
VAAARALSLPPVDFKDSVAFCLSSGIFILKYEHCVSLRFGLLPQEPRAFCTVFAPVGLKSRRRACRSTAAFTVAPKARSSAEANHAYGLHDGAQCVKGRGQLS